MLNEAAERSAVPPMQGIARLDSKYLPSAFHERIEAVLHRLRQGRKALAGHRPAAISDAVPDHSTNPAFEADTSRQMADADTLPKGTAAETLSFQAEVAELLRLMVHSVYSETDIFLRELISNASDACDRLRYEAIARPELTADGAPFAIRIAPDSTADTLTITDNGVGMSRQELIDNLGTVARSGTRAFISQLAEAKDGAGLIGQFGVGFYSAFMVAERIEVVSRRAGSSETWVWTSSGELASRSLRPARRRRRAFRAAPRSCCI